MAQNDDAPKKPYIPIRTGNNNDPSDNTGLAHYLEHMMFKGTNKLGTGLGKRKSIIRQISGLYELQNPSKNPKKEKRKID